MPKESKNNELAKKEKQDQQKAQPTSSKSGTKSNAAIAILIAAGAATLSLVALHNIGESERKKQKPDEAAPQNKHAFFESDIMKNINAGAKKVADDAKDFAQTQARKLR